MIVAPRAAGGRWRAVLGLGKAWGWGAKACTCPVAGTIVETASGCVPIEQVSPGDAVVARHQHDPADAPPQIGYVSDVHRRIVPAVLRLSLAGGGELGVTPDHEVWIEGRGWTFAGLVQPGDVLLGPAGEPLEIDGVRVDRRPTTVYNLEVEHTHTFFAEGAWVHNGRACPAVSGPDGGEWGPHIPLKGD